MRRTKPKTKEEGQKQLSKSLARLASKKPSPDPMNKYVPITAIGFGQCRFVVDDTKIPALCCGQPAGTGSWCAEHRRLVFVRVNHEPKRKENGRSR